MNLRIGGILPCRYRNESQYRDCRRIVSAIMVAVLGVCAVAASPIILSAQSTSLANGMTSGSAESSSMSHAASESLSTGSRSADRLPPDKLPRHLWNFGRGSDKNFDDWPDNWQRRVGRRYPKYVKVAIAPKDPAAEQQLRAIDTMVIREWPRLRRHLDTLPVLPPSLADAVVDRYLKVDLDGGLVMTQSPPVKTSHVYQYRFSVKVMTHGLRHDRARAEFVFVNDDGDEVETHGTESISGTTDWTELVLDRIRAPRAATGVFVRLIVEGAEDGLEDIRGEIGFDDISIEPFPQLQLVTDHPMGIHTVGGPVDVAATVLGLPSGATQVLFRLMDVDGREITRQISDIPNTDAANVKRPASGLPAKPASGGPRGMEVHWELPDLQPGFYRVMASLQGRNLRTLATETTFAVVDPAIGQPHQGSFGWTLVESGRDMPPRELAAWLAQLGVDWVKIPCWIEPNDTATADRILDASSRLQDVGIQTIGLLDVPPESQVPLFDIRGRRDVVASQLFRDSRVWQPLLEPVMTRLTLKVKMWQLGGNQDYSFLDRSHLQESIAEIATGLQGYGQPIEVAICWPWTERDLMPSETSWNAVQRSSDPELTADELDEYLRLEELQGGSNGPRTWVVVEPIEQSRYDRNARILDLAKRMAVVRKHRVQAAFVSEPRDPERGLLNADGRPEEMLLPWRTTSLMIGDLRQMGSLRLRSKAENIVFAGANRAVVMLWSPLPCEELIYLGDQVQVVDIWGRRQPLELVEVEGQVAHRVEIGPRPIFIAGADPTLLAFRMSVEVEQEQVDSLLGQTQPVDVTFTNPTREGLGGSLSVLAPEHWSFNEPSIPWELQAGKSATLQFNLVLGNSAKVGKYEIPLRFEHQSIPSKKFTVYRDLTVGPIGLRIETETRLLADNQLRVEIEMTNDSNVTQAYDCMLFPQGGRQYQRRFITVKPGETVRREFYWDDAESLLGKTMLLRAGEQDGKRILNYEIPVRR
ncbi:NEW3 domain-containing protein [Novipirellula caenicola]|uniref:Alpha-galactosidase NEW3 domain-containing protein n=1 Tax=Novipirellula caenicola TaxID=1536901 RepID=A0ABP9VTX0_9BACT